MSRCNNELDANEAFLNKQLETQHQENERLTRLIDGAISESFCIYLCYLYLCCRLLTSHIFLLFCLAALEKAPKIRRELQDAKQAHGKAEETFEAHQKDLRGLIDKKLELQAEVEAERNASATLCGVPRGEGAT